MDNELEGTDDLMLVSMSSIAIKCSCARKGDRCENDGEDQYAVRIGYSVVNCGSLP